MYFKRTFVAALAVVALATTGASSGTFAGHQFKPRDAAWYLSNPWQDQTQRVKALATEIAESKLFVGAFNNNLRLLKTCSVGQVVLNPELGQRMTVLDPAKGKVQFDDGTIEFHPPESEVVTTRDLGLFQINVAASRLEDLEPLLWTDSDNPTDWARVARYNVATAHSLWTYRRFQPWVAYTSGWATWNSWWVYRHQINPETGELEAVGPWVATGRYLQKSILGWANFHLLVRHDKTAAGALAFAKKQQAKWNVQGELGLKPNDQHQLAVAWLSFPPKPTEPPADGHGPRPVPNNGF